MKNNGRNVQRYQCRDDHPVEVMNTSSNVYPVVVSPVHPRPFDVKAITGHQPTDDLSGDRQQHCNHRKRSQWVVAEGTVLVAKIVNDRFRVKREAAKSTVVLPKNAPKNSKYQQTEKHITDFLVPFHPVEIVGEAGHQHSADAQDQQPMKDPCG